MQMQYEKRPSAYLRREMEFKQYGKSGVACLVLPTGSGRFYEWEDAGMTGALAGLIESGKITLFCADSINAESWLGRGDARRRAEMQERWHAYLCEELLPVIEDRCPGTSPLVLGCDLGAMQAALLALREPERFAGCVALSGRYAAADFFGPDKDDLIFRNDPMQFLPALPAGHPRLQVLKSSTIWLCAGQGQGEEEPLASAQALKKVMQMQGLAPELDVWGNDVTHDWYWWQKEMPYLLGKALERLAQEPANNAQ